MIVINSSTRQFNIPGADMTFGVEADAGSERKYFQCPRYVGNNLDLMGSFVRLNYRNANGEVDSYLVEDMTVDGDNVQFSWELSPKVTAYKGQIRFVLCVVGPDTKVAWHTTLGTGIVLEGLEPEYAVIQAGTADVVAQLIAMVDRQTEAVEAEGANQIKAVQTAAKTAQAASVTEIEAKGVNVRESIPGDYTSLENTVDSLVRGRAGAIVCEAAGTAVVVNDASDMVMQGLRIFGRSTQDGVPTPDAPVEIVSVENPVVTVTDGTENNIQTLSITHTLPGIPVTSGGNYTDSDGQQWICDEVDLGCGVYVQRVRNLVFSGVEAIDDTWYPVAIYHIHSPAPRVNLVHDSMRSSHFSNVSCGNTLGTSVAIGNLDKLGFASSDELIAYFAEQYEQNNPVTIQYAIATPIETPLSETEIAAYRALHSNYPNTTVLNDAGAHMVVKYAADTKLYIDNKIKEVLG